MGETEYGYFSKRRFNIIIFYVMVVMVFYLTSWDYFGDIYSAKVLFLMCTLLIIPVTHIGVIIYDRIFAIRMVENRIFEIQKLAKRLIVLKDVKTGKVKELLTRFPDDFKDLQVGQRVGMIYNINNNIGQYSFVPEESFDVKKERREYRKRNKYVIKDYFIYKEINRSF